MSCEAQFALDDVGRMIGAFSNFSIYSSGDLPRLTTDNCVRALRRDSTATYTPLRKHTAGQILLYRIVRKVGGI
jgi:hypothetical protein